MPDTAAAGTNEKPPEIIIRQDPHGGGLQRKDLEPMTVIPGRYRAISADIDSILNEFEALSEVRARSGAFPRLRNLFCQRSFSMVTERCKMEQVWACDLFQFICGICWRFLFDVYRLERRVGVVFLVYLLHQTQHPERFAVPVDILILEVLADLQQECLKAQLFLECPAILQRMLETGAISVGMRATCRNLYFDRRGRLMERQAFRDEESAEAANANRASSQSAGSGVLAERVHISTSAALLPSPSDPAAALAPASASVADLSTSDGREILNFKGALRDAQDYDALKILAGMCTAEQGQALGAPSAGSAALQISTAASLYERGTPPLPRAVVQAGNDESHMEEPIRPRRPVKRRRVVADSTSSGESGDSLMDRIGGPPPGSTCAEVAQMQGESQEGLPTMPVRMRSKRARTSFRLGLDQAWQRQTARLEAAREQAEPSASSSAAQASSSRGADGTQQAAQGHGEVSHEQPPEAQGSGSSTVQTSRAPTVKGDAAVDRLNEQPATADAASSEGGAGGTATDSAATPTAVEKVAVKEEQVDIEGGAMSGADDVVMMDLCSDGD